MEPRADLLRKAPDLETLQKRWELINLALADSSYDGITPVHFSVETGVIEGITNLLICQSHQVPDSLTILMKERTPPTYVMNIAPTFIDDAITLLQLVDTKRVSYTERLARIYEHAYRRGLEPNTTFERFPWERQRYLREIHYHFQMQSHFAEKAEQIIFHNDKSINSWLEFYKYRDSVYKDKRYGMPSEMRPPDPPLLSFGEPTFLGLDIRWIYHTEVKRRALILKLALIQYFQDKEQLPETLDKLGCSRDFR